MLLFQLEEEVWLDDEQQQLVEELKMEILEERRKQKGHNFDRHNEVRASRLINMKSKGGINVSQIDT